MADELPEFLLARIAEDEAVVREATQMLEDTGQPWVADNIAHGDPDRRGPEHTARWSPARVLAECDAKRQVVEDFQILHRDYREGHTPTLEARRFQALIAVARLASVYADHPDYQQEWKP